MTRITPEYLLTRWTQTLNDNATLLDTGLAEKQAYAIRGHKGEFSVAIPFVGNQEINEEFNAVRLYTCVMSLGDENSKLLMLSYSGYFPPRSFAALCSEFVDPGSQGELRNQIVASPVEWWRSWKELLGNKNVEAKVYDVIAEMITLIWLQQSGAGQIVWHGPDYSSYDIHTPSDLYEVKSTLVKSEKMISIHNQFQAESIGIPLHIVFCVMEPSPTGVSINELANKLIDQGILDKDELEKKLSSLGFAQGRSDRDRKFKLLMMELYEVDAEFPVIDPLPPHVVDIEYVVDLGGLQSAPITWSL